LPRLFIDLGKDSQITVFDAQNNTENVPRLNNFSRGIFLSQKKNGKVLCFRRFEAE